MIVPELLKIGLLRLQLGSSAMGVFVAAVYVRTCGTLLAGVSSAAARRE